MSVTSISNKNKYLLWVKSGGRCQYRGCNKSLYQDIITKRNFNQAYIAHIVADVPGGPRGDLVRSPLLADDLGNLMLLCDTCHRRIDKYDAKTQLHVFPAMPIATAIELGRVWMPKADMPLIIYDENTANSGFFKAIEISNTEHQS